MLTCLLWFWRVTPVCPPSFTLRIKSLSSPLSSILGGMILRWVYPYACLIRDAQLLPSFGFMTLSLGSSMGVLHPGSLFRSECWTGTWKQLERCRNRYHICADIHTPFILGELELAVFSGKRSWIIHGLPFTHCLSSPYFHSLSFQPVTNLCFSNISASLHRKRTFFPIFLSSLIGF